jgi:PAS domain S-box-containing protein
VADTPLDFSALVHAIGDAVMACDRNGRMVLWNPACERMFGYTAAEALGASLDLIIPERLRKRHWEGYDHTMATGITKYGHDVLRVPAVDKAGRTLSIAFTVAMTYDAQGQVESIVSVVRDETARFQEDRELRKRLAAAEARAGQAGSTDTPGSA